MMRKRGFMALFVCVMLACSSFTLGAAAKTNLKNYSIRFVFKNGSQEVQSIEKRYVRNGIMLREDTINITTNQADQATITRDDKKLMWTVNFAENWYLEGPNISGVASLAGDASVESIIKKTAAKVREEKYQGYPCEVYLSDRDGVKIEYWLYKGDYIPLKMVKYDQGKLVSLMESSEFSLEPPPQTLFELPAGCKKLNAF